jgi:tRNA (guanosine-2'-O-)-methyltransferase
MILIFQKPSALFFGTERDGLSRRDLQKANADDFLKIPMVGFTES